jgi:hypothetical protein
LPLPVEADNVKLDDGVDDNNLGADQDDNTLLCSHDIEDIIGSASLCGFSPHILVAEGMHLVSSNKPASFIKADHSPT